MAIKLNVATVTFILFSIPKRVSEVLWPPAFKHYIIFSFQGAFARTTDIVADFGLPMTFQTLWQQLKTYIYQHIQDLRESKRKIDRTQTHTSKHL